MFDDVEFTELQSILLKELLMNEDMEDEKYIVNRVSEYTQIKRKDVAKELSELKDYVKFKINAYHEHNRHIDSNTHRVYTENNVRE